MTLYLALMYLISLALGYVLAFTGATLAIGLASRIPRIGAFLASTG